MQVLAINKLVFVRLKGSRCLDGTLSQRPCSFSITMQAFNLVLLIPKNLAACKRVHLPCIASTLTSNESSMGPMLTATACSILVAARLATAFANAYGAHENSAARTRLLGRAIIRKVVDRRFTHFFINSSSSPVVHPPQPNDLSRLARSLLRIARGWFAIRGCSLHAQIPQSHSCFRGCAIANVIRKRAVSDKARATKKPLPQATRSCVASITRSPPLCSRGWYR